MKRRVAILDYGVGNLRSVWHACKRFSKEVEIVSAASEYVPASHVVLPGVGTFNVAISEIRNRKFDELIRKSFQELTPILGICIGMHVLARTGYENGENCGLGIFNAEVRHLSDQGEIPSERIPHIGWSRVESLNSSLRPAKLFGSSHYYYFAHSYSYAKSQRQDVLSEAVLGKLRIPAVVRTGNVIGVQFHPEKSGTIGLQFLEAFFNSEIATNAG